MNDAMQALVAVPSGLREAAPAAGEKPMDVPVELVWDVKCQTGESPVWDQARNRVLFCDIPAGVIHAYGIEAGTTESWQLPELVGSFGVCATGRLVVALRHRVVLFDPEKQSIAALAGLTGQPANVRFNDGKVGPDGCFWVGTMDESPAKQPLGVLYRVTPDGGIEPKADGYVTTNGLAWAPDGRTMFHSDSRRAYIETWDFDPATGAISNRRQIATVPDDQGRPDGGACDVEGCYWSAGVSADSLNRYSATGKLLRRIKLPVPAPTMPCFGGHYIYLTTLRSGKDAETLARYPTMGGLFRLPAPVDGAPVDLFADC